MYFGRWPPLGLRGCAARVPPCRAAFSLFSRAAQGCIRGTANQGRRYLRAYPSAPLEAMRYGGLNRVRRFPSGCILCGKKDKVGLIAPCECYKKNDTGQVHIACLKRLIQNQREDDEVRTSTGARATALSCISFRPISSVEDTKQLQFATTLFPVLLSHPHLCPPRS